MLCAAVPVLGGRIVSPYGWRGGSLHAGVDIHAPEGTTVRAIVAGRVVVSAASGQLEGYGNTVVLEHGPRLYSLYAHLGRRDVAVGELVSAGTRLGTVGRSAGTRAAPWQRFRDSPAHLHLEFLDRWPPRATDRDRIAPSAVFSALGLVAPVGAPMRVLCTIAGKNAGSASPRPFRAAWSAGSLLPLLLFVVAGLGQKGPTGN